MPAGENEFTMNFRSGLERPVKRVPRDLYIPNAPPFDKVHNMTLCSNTA